jgi:hypothetical protein
MTVPNPVTPQAVEGAGGVGDSGGQGVISATVESSGTLSAGGAGGVPEQK